MTIGAGKHWSYRDGRRTVAGKRRRDWFDPWKDQLEEQEPHEAAWQIRKRDLDRLRSE